MKTIFRRGRRAALAIALVGASPTLAAPNLPLNAPTPINGIETVCTGIGDDAQHDARWDAYPLKIVFAGKGGQWVTDADVTITQDGKDVLSVHCSGPWLLAKVAAGQYRITGVLEGQSAAANAIAPATGQGRVILRFPNAGGAISPQHQP